MSLDQDPAPVPLLLKVPRVAVSSTVEGADFEECPSKPLIEWHLGEDSVVEPFVLVGLTRMFVNLWLLANIHWASVELGKQKRSNRVVEITLNIFIYNRFKIKHLPPYICGS